MATEKRIIFLRKQLPKDRVYDFWLGKISRLETLCTTNGTRELEEAVDNSMDIGFHLFPLIDSIAYTLFNKRGQTYLRKLGYSKKESFLMFSMFRNGLLHNSNAYRLRYKDGDVLWGMHSGAGSTGLGGYFPGYTCEDNPDENRPADKAISISNINGNTHAILALDTLACQIRHDLKIRKENDPREHIGIIYGQEMEGKRPRSGQSMGSHLES